MSHIIRHMCICTYSETSLIRHSMGPENNVGLGGCWIMECLLPYLCMVTVPHIMVKLERMLDYRGVGLGGCWIMECLLPYLCMVTVPHIMVGLERCRISEVSLYLPESCLSPLTAFHESLHMAWVYHTFPPLLQTLVPSTSTLVGYGTLVGPPYPVGRGSCSWLNTLFSTRNSSPRCVV